MLYEEEAAVDVPYAMHDPAQPNERDESDTSNDNQPELISALQAMIELSKITQEILSKIFSTKMIKKPRRDLVLCRSTRLEELSLRLSRWHTNLAAELRWNQWNPSAGGLKLHVLILQSVTCFSLQRELPLHSCCSHN